MPTGSAVRRRINRYAPADCARSSSAARRSYCAPMPRSGPRPCPSLGPPAASRRAHEPCPAQMLWAPLPLPAVVPNEVLRLASEHRTDSTTGSAATTAAWSIRHYCRNLKCRSKLPAPIENVRKAFCCRSCHSAFYRTRCLVCEKDIRTDPLTGKKRKWSSRKFCGRKCNAEARRFPHVYAWGLPDPVRRTSDLRSAHSTRLISALANDRGWRWWGGDGDGDHSLYDRDGLTIARVVLEDGGRYHLRTPVTIPRQAWASLDEARRGAESFA